MTFGVLVAAGTWAFFQVPISLLPNIDSSKIVVKVRHPNASASLVELSALQPLRETLSTIYGLTDIESVSASHVGNLYLTFDRGTQMDLAFIEVNEKLDLAMNLLPISLERPQVAKISSSDIPVVRIQINPTLDEDYLQVSNLTDKIIKKRFEQIDGVALIDINGVQEPTIEVTPISGRMQAFGIQDSELVRFIQESNIELGSLIVRDGHYRYFVKLANGLKTVKDFKKIPIRLAQGNTIPLEEIAVVKESIEDPTGYHLFNGKRGLVLAIHKESNARMNKLLNQIKGLVEVLKSEYPQVEFDLTQNQSFVLEAGISNLYQSLLFGVIFCIACLFFFSGNYIVPLLIGISIPASIVLTFIFFHAFGLTFNIISLSGLALGIGMLIDNSIVVLNHISSIHKAGNSVRVSCIIGVNEVAAPVLSSVLTTAAVYGPLVYLSGMAGELVLDQGIALTISLLVSLAIAFLLNPVMYKLFIKEGTHLKEDTFFYLMIKVQYHKLIHAVFKRKRGYLAGTMLTLPIGLTLLFLLPINTLPTVEYSETVVDLDWNEPIQIDENRQRVSSMVGQVQKYTNAWEADIGIRQFLLELENNSVQKNQLYYRCSSAESKIKSEQLLRDWLGANYPDATYSIQNAENAFTQLFEDNSPYFEVRFKPSTIDQMALNLDNELNRLTGKSWQRGLGLFREENIEIEIDDVKLAVYDVSLRALDDELKLRFGNNAITNIEMFGDRKVVRLKPENEGLDKRLEYKVIARNGEAYPLSAFVNYRVEAAPRYFTADRSGVYQSYYLANDKETDFNEIRRLVETFASRLGMSVQFKGSYFNSRQLLNDMMFIFIVTCLLLYFILAVEFENLVHPLLVMLSMPLGVVGSLIALYISGGTLDVMSAIGFVVVLGIIVDDPILKVETMNRLRKQYKRDGSDNNESLENAIHAAGDICLKPVLVTSLTTCLALLPILFMKGIGAELQKPMVWVVVGGLSIGTFLVLWFVPLSYWFLERKSKSL